MKTFGAISIYPTPDSLQNKVDEYFDYCFIMENKFGRMIPKCIVPPTFSGLARYLGFGTRKALIEYADKNGNEMYEDILNDAKLRIEDFYEGKLVMAKGPSTGLQFALKNNCGWDDTTKQQITGDAGMPVVFSWGFDGTQIDASQQKAIDKAEEAKIIETKVLAEPRVTEKEKEEYIEKRFDEEGTEETQELDFEVEF